MKFIPAGFSRAMWRQVLQMKKNSPHYFFIGGVAGMIGSTVLACRATLKLHDTLDEIQDDVESVHELRHHDSSSSKYPEEQWSRDVIYVYTKSTVKIVKLYGPAVIVGGVSIAALANSHIQLNRRNAALMAAYSALQVAFEDYRGRVREKYGEDEELDLYHSVQKTEIVTDERGQKSIEKYVEPSTFSAYSKIFDKKSVHWTDNAEFNRLFLTCQLSYANALLVARGHVFLNEVYDMLDVERTKPGSVVGWIMHGEGDNYIDFHVYRVYEETQLEYNPNLMIDFNVDGVIYDKI